MGSVRFFSYQACGTCRKARAWLQASGISFEEVPIRERPPEPAEILRLLAAGDGRRTTVLNSSGADYRQPGTREMIAAMDDAAFSSHLSRNGNLVKRPVLLGPGFALAGFSADRWRSALDGVD